MRVLIVRLSHLGDVVLALPLFHALRSAHAEAEIGWAVQPEFAGLIRALPGLSRTFLFERRGGARAWVRLTRELRAWRPEWAVDAQGNAKSAAVMLVSGAPRRSGPARIDWRERVGALAVNDPAPRATGMHAMDRVEVLARHVAPGTPLRTDLALSPSELALGRDLLRARLPSEGRRGWILHLTRPDDVKAWPAGAFAALARRLVEAGERVLILSGPAEAAVGARLAAELPAHPRLSHWQAQRGLRPLAAFFQAAAEEGLRLVGCDSGPAHLAAASGLGVDLLAGPQDPRRTGPFAPPGSPARHTVLQRTSPPSCQPCLSRRCTHPDGPVCMSGLSAERVASILLASGERLGATGGRAPQ